MNSIKILPLLFLFPALCYGSIIEVPADHPTIQQAIDAALSQDLIMVSPGTYVENIDFQGKAIIVRGLHGPEVTVIDGNQADCVVIFKNGETQSTVLEGFTITNGGNVNWGSGIFCFYSSPIIKNNIITGNTAVFDGGGICCDTSAPTIENNTISWNRSLAYGGGISCINDSFPIIENNTICWNTAGTGGGICSRWKSSPVIRNNVILENRINGTSTGGGVCTLGSKTGEITGNTIVKNMGGEGGGIYMSTSTTPVYNNMVISNLASSLGGGIHCDNCTLNLGNNTVAGNQCMDTGGGIHVLKSDLIVENSIFWNNSAPQGSQLSLGTASKPSTLAISWSNVEGGLSGTLVELYSTLNWGLSMMDKDPLFVDGPGKDFHLTYGSPCRNAGDPTVVTGIHDFEGDPRIVESLVDMGADEFSPHLYYTGTATPAEIVHVKCVGFPGKGINGIILGFDVFDPPLVSDYGLWYIDQPMHIVTGLGNIPANGIALFSERIPSTPAAPYIIYLQAAIDSQLTNLCTVNVQ